MADFDGQAYQARFDALAAQGVDVHGEVRFLLSFRPASVLDAGCGTGRVAIELAARGVEAVGVDIDASMLAEARRRAAALNWIQADLAALDLGRTFDAVILAGNVPLFCPPGSRSALVRACAAHVSAGGVLIAGFQLGRGYTLAEWETGCADSGLDCSGNWSTWDGDPFSAESDYVVSAHSRPGS